MNGAAARSAGRREAGWSALAGGLVWVGLVAVSGVRDLRGESWAQMLLLLGALVVVPLGLRLAATAATAEEGNASRDAAGAAAPAPAGEAGRVRGAAAARRLLRWAIAVQPVAAACLMVSFALPAGYAAAGLALPWTALTLLVAAGGLLRFLSRADRWRPAGLAFDAGLALLAVGGGWTLLARGGWRPLAFTSTIVLLTAIHFHFAGFALPLATARAARDAPRALAAAACWGVVLGVPLVAVGITASQLGAPRPVEAFAAVWMATAAVASAVLHLGCVTRRAGSPWARALWALAVLALVFAMPLAALYGLRGWSPLALDVPTMRALHGTVLALGFGVAALVGWNLADRRR